MLGYQRKDFEAVIEQLASGGIKPAQMITGRIAMEDLVEHGFRPLIENKEKEVKILVDVARKTRAADEAEAEGAGLSKVDSARG